MRLVVAAAIVLVLACPLPYADWYAGDAVVHLVYAENAARGHFFEFNRGEPSSGETSIGYMLIVAAIFRAARPDHVPIIVKIVDTAAWYGVVVVSYLAARRVLPALWPLIVAVVVGTNPGSVSNATIGMESGLFALAATTVAWLIVQWRWLWPETPLRPARESILGVLLALCVALRPEGVPLTGIVLVYRIWRARTDRVAAPRIVRQTLLTAIPPAVVLVGFAICLHSRTGDWLPQSAFSRAALSASESIWIGPLWFNLRFAERLVVYAPLTLLFAIGTWLVLSGRQCLDGAVDGLLLLEFWVFFALYSTVFGAVHLARYITFLMPPLALIAAGGARWLWANWTAIAGRLRFSRAAAFGGIGLLLASVFSAETYARLGDPGGVVLADVMAAPGHRAQASDDLLAELRDPSVRPVSIALQEAQLRYWLDDRFVVRSLDGRVDRALLSYVHRGNYDHLGYLRASDVRYLVGTVNYNRDRTRWALADLQTLRDGETLRKDGLVFTRLPDDLFEVSR